MNKTQAFLITAYLLFIACGEQLMNNAVNTDMPIVESYLQEGSSTLTVKLYSLEVYLKDAYLLSQPIGGLNVKINDKTLTETSAGTYSLDLKTDTIRGSQVYDLSFDYLGQTISGSTLIPEKVDNLKISPESITRETSYYWDTTDTTEIKLTWDDPESSYYQIYIESPADSDMPDFGGDGAMQFRRQMMQPFKGDSYISSSREFRTAGHYWIYVYRVNKDYVDLYERISSTDLANPGSEIQNAFGIFTAMSVAKVGFQVQIQ
jgi:hypothetical protein